MGCCQSASSASVKEPSQKNGQQNPSKYEPKPVEIKLDLASKPATTPETNGKPATQPVKTDAKVDTQKSLLSCVIDLILNSETLRDAINEEEIVAGPLKTSKHPNGSLALLRLFIQAFASSNPQSKTGEIDQHLSKYAGSHHPAVQVLASIMTGIVLLRAETSTNKDKINDLLAKIIDLPLTTIEGSEAESLLFDGLALDLKAKNIDINKDDKKSGIGKIKNFVSSSSEEAFWPLNKNFPYFHRQLVLLSFSPSEDLIPEVSSLIETVKAKTSETLKTKTLDLDTLGPLTYHFGPMTLSVFTCLPSFRFGFASFDGSKIMARVKRISVRMFQEPDIETLRCVEFTDGLTIGGKKVGYNEPLYANVSVKTIVKKIAEKDDNPNLITDFDPVFLFYNDSQVYYSLAKERLLEKDANIGNQATFRILLTKQKDLMDPNTIKIAFTPKNHENDSKTYNYLFTAKRDDSLQVVLDRLSAIAGNLEDSEGGNSFDMLKKSLVFRQSLEPLQETQFTALHKKSQDTIKSQGWKTKISAILDSIKSSSQPQLSSNLRKVDFIISLHTGIFGRRLAPGNVGEAGMLGLDNLKTKVPKIKPTLSEFFCQLIGQSQQTNPKAFNELMLRDLLPSYLFVDASQLCTLTDLSLELKLTVLQQMVDEAGVELGIKYRPLGFILEQKVGNDKVFIAYHPDNKQIGMVNYQQANGSMASTSLKKLDPTCIRGVYFERLVKQL